MADMIVAGAGTAECNGTYIYDSIYNGKPSYIGGVPDTAIYWDGAKWRIYNGGVFYYSTENVATPDLVVTWVRQYGALPIPTVTAVSSGVPKQYLHYARLRSN